MSKQGISEQQGKQRNNWRRTLYAYHEAGHAVVGHIIGRCVGEVSIIADAERGYRGYCLFNEFAESMQGLPQWRKGQPNPERITIMYAGTVAMSLICERRGWKYERWRRVDHGDFDNIYLWSIEMFGNDDEQALAVQKSCKEQAREILTGYWSAVEALSSALLVQRMLSGHEAHRIMQQTIDATVTDWRMGTWNTGDSNLLL